jgi:predicted dehydrogenase
MDTSGRIRWGILGTANIARASFLPGLREAGGGVAAAVAGRDRARAEAYAAANGVERATEGYDRIIADPAIDAVYIPLPNSLHAEWTMRGLEAGKAVLTEKPLCTSPAETSQVLKVAAGRLLWEAFVFPFHSQYARLGALLGEGAIGEVREIDAFFFFRVRSPENIRLRPELAGGALNDVGCYPVHLACLLYGHEPARVRTSVRMNPSGVDIETAGLMVFEGGRLLYFGCGMDRGYDTFGRIVGTEGEIRLTNPYHPRPEDTLEIRRPDKSVLIERPTQHERSFSPAIRHIHEVLRGEHGPAHLAVDDAMSTARALEAARAARGA